MADETVGGEVDEDGELGRDDEEGIRPRAPAGAIATADERPESGEDRDAKVALPLDRVGGEDALPVPGVLVLPRTASIESPSAAVERGGET